jgi:hypothetical protein
MKEKKRKAGRPKLPKGQVKNVIAIRLSETERTAAEQAAKKRGLSLSEWVRTLLLSGA